MMGMFLPHTATPFVLSQYHLLKKNWDLELRIRRPESLHLRKLTTLPSASALLLLTAHWQLLVLSQIYSV